VSFGKSEVRSAFASIRILEKPPDRPEDWKKIAEVLCWRGELADALARWRALAAEFSLPAIPVRLDDAARTIQALLEQVFAIADSIDRHVPLVQSEVERLFPCGLNAVEIVSDVDPHRGVAPSTQQRSRQTRDSQRETGHLHRSYIAEHHGLSVRNRGQSGYIRKQNCR
jgi:hypothetical protein